jgi:hypothetical protein
VLEGRLGLEGSLVCTGGSTKAGTGTGTGTETGTETGLTCN